ncbi:MAG: AAA family ATPase [Verrucomicrobia bacterium]|nr:AAA family ATPase [Verrucomicrobiota bacterium]
MKRTAAELLVLDQILAVDRNRASVEERVAQLQTLRTSEEASGQIDQALCERVMTLQRGLLEARDNQRKLKSLLERIEAPPWFPATFIQALVESNTTRALVQIGNTRRVVVLGSRVDPASLGTGDEVLLNGELNLVVAKSPNGVPRGGETAVFERRMADGRLVLRHRDDEILVDPASGLKDEALVTGDQIRCDRGAWLAFEKIERATGSRFFIDQTPNVRFDQIGGLEVEIERIKRGLSLHLFHAETARKYGLRRRGSILLVGPSGTGKTMLGKALANWLATLTPAGQCRFMNIKPSELHSLWYGQTEANYRETFRAARAASAIDPRVPTVMFFDEVDAIGMARGQFNAHVDDRVLTSFMAELDGLADRGNIVVVGATNRRDALDPALLRPGRLGDVILEVPRPRMQAAEEIFARHLGTAIPLAENGHGGDIEATRAAIIRSAVVRIFAPNGDNQLATLQFRDGKRRTVRAADLVNGALIANIVNSAVERACHREVETGEAGLTAADVGLALEQEFVTAARALTPRNCRQHLMDLPHDLDVVSVEPVVRRTGRTLEQLKSLKEV